MKMIMSIALALALCFAFTTPALADDAEVYEQFDQSYIPDSCPCTTWFFPPVGSYYTDFGEVTNALTAGTPSLWDDTGAAFVHPIQGHTPYFTSVESATRWVSGSYAYEYDSRTNFDHPEYAGLFCLADGLEYPDAYFTAEAWSNPEELMRVGEGDSEDHAIMLASVLIDSCDQVDIPGGDQVWVTVGDIPGGGHAWVTWYDASAGEFYAVDPTINQDVIDANFAGFRTIPVQLYDGTFELFLNHHEVFGAYAADLSRVGPNVYYNGPDRPLVTGLNKGIRLENGAIKNITRGLNSGTGHGITVGLNKGNGISTILGGGTGLNGSSGTTTSLNGR